MAEVDKIDIINTEPEKLWPDILRGMGGEYEILANFQEHPSLN